MNFTEMKDMLEILEGNKANLDSLEQFKMSYSKAISALKNKVSKEQDRELIDTLTSPIDSIGYTLDRLSKGKSSINYNATDGDMRKLGMSVLKALLETKDNKGHAIFEDLSMSNLLTILLCGTNTLISIMRTAIENDRVVDNYIDSLFNTCDTDEAFFHRVNTYSKPFEIIVDIMDKNLEKVYIDNGLINGAIFKLTKELDKEIGLREIIKKNKSVNDKTEELINKAIREVMEMDDEDLAQIHDLSLDEIMESTEDDGVKYFLKQTLEGIYNEIHSKDNNVNEDNDTNEHDDNDINKDSDNEEIQHVIDSLASGNMEDSYVKVTDDIMNKMYMLNSDFINGKLNDLIVISKSDMTREEKNKIIRKISDEVAEKMKTEDKDVLFNIIKTMGLDIERAHYLDKDKGDIYKIKMSELELDLIKSYQDALNSKDIDKATSIIKECVRLYSNREISEEFFEEMKKQNIKISSKK